MFCWRVNKRSQSFPLILINEYRLGGLLTLDRLRTGAGQGADKRRCGFCMCHLRVPPASASWVSNVQQVSAMKSRFPFLASTEFNQLSLARLHMQCEMASPLLLPSLQY